MGVKSRAVLTTGLSAIFMIAGRPRKIKDMLKSGESQEHRRIKLALARSFDAKDWKVECIDGEGKQTNLVKNENSVGDGEDKRPDIDAKDLRTNRIIRGKAKVDNGDFDSEHSITQYRLFSNRTSKGVDSWLIIGVPYGAKEKMEAILDRELEDGPRGNVAVWEF